jgi:hypothetical protein
MGMEKVIFADDAVGCAAFYDDATNKHESWKPTALLTKRDLPRLVYLPPQVPVFGAEEQGTFWEVHQYIDGVIANNTIQENDGELKVTKHVHLWGLTFSLQSTQIETSPNGAVTISTVFLEQGQIIARSRDTTTGMKSLPR